MSDWKPTALDDDLSSLIADAKNLRFSGESTNAASTSMNDENEEIIEEVSAKSASDVHDPSIVSIDFFVDPNGKKMRKIIRKKNPTTVIGNGDRTTLPPSLERASSHTATPSSSQPPQQKKKLWSSLRIKRGTKSLHDVWADEPNNNNNNNNQSSSNPATPHSSNAPNSNTLHPQPPTITTSTAASTSPNKSTSGHNRNGSDQKVDHHLTTSMPNNNHHQRSNSPTNHSGTTSHSVASHFHQMMSPPEHSTTTNHTNGHVTTSNHHAAGLSVSMGHPQTQSQAQTQAQQPSGLSVSMGHNHHQLKEIPTTTTTTSGLSVSMNLGVKSKTIAARPSKGHSRSASMMDGSMFKDPSSSPLSSSPTSSTLEKLKPEKKTNNLRAILKRLASGDLRKSSKEENHLDEEKTLEELLAPPVPQTNLSPNSSKLKKSKIFGQPFDSFAEAPSFLHDILETLRNHMDTEGIFRISGSFGAIQELKHNIDAGKSINWAQEDVHNLTGTLKAFLRELPEPIIPHQYRHLILRAPDIFKTMELAVCYLTSIISRLPNTNYKFLNDFFRLLFDISQRESVNKMSISNLATVFGPTLMPENGTDILGSSARSTSVTEILIEHYASIFKTRDVFVVVVPARNAHSSSVESGNLQWSVGDELILFHSFDNSEQPQSHDTATSYFALNFKSEKFGRVWKRDLPDFELSPNEEHQVKAALRTSQQQPSDHHHHHDMGLTAAQHRHLQEKEHPELQKKQVLSQIEQIRDLRSSANPDLRTSGSHASNSEHHTTNSNAIHNGNGSGSLPPLRSSNESQPQTSNQTAPTTTKNISLTAATKPKGHNATFSDGFLDNGYKH